jgi:hypothetical protein
MLIHINLEIRDEEVPSLREAIGWERRDDDYPTLFQRCNFWAGARDPEGVLIAFGYIAGTWVYGGHISTSKISKERTWPTACKRIIK